MTRPADASHLHPRVTSFRSRRSTVSSGQQQTWDRLWPELGMHARYARRTRRRCSTPRRGSAGRRPSCWRSASGTGTSTLAMAKAEPRRRRGRRRGLPARAGTAALRDRPGSTSPTSGWSAATASTCSSTCSARIADRGAGVLPRPVAQGAPPQAPAAAAGHRRPDRRPAAPRRGAARRDRPRRATPSRSPRSATPNPGCVASPPSDGPADLGAAAHHQVRDEGAARGQRRRRTALGEALSA